MHKIIGNRLSEVYNTTTNGHTKKIFENAIAVAKSSRLSSDQVIPILEKSLQGQLIKDKAVDDYFTGVKNMSIVKSMGITEALSELTALPIYEGNEKFKYVVDHYQTIKEYGNVADHAMIGGFVENMKSYNWNKSVSKIASLMENKMNESMPYVMVANAWDNLKDFEDDPSYALIFKRLSTAMTLPANMVGRYIIQSLDEYQAIPQVMEVIQAFIMMEKSWVSRTLPHSTSVMTAAGRFKTTGLNAATTTMNAASNTVVQNTAKPKHKGETVDEQKVFMVKNRLFINNHKAIQEVRNYKALPESFRKLYENMTAPNICMGDDMDVCASENGHNICIKFGGMVTSNGDPNSIYFTIDGVKYDTVDAAVMQMSTMGISEELINSLLDIYAYAYADKNCIEVADNAMQIEDEQGGMTIVLVIDQNNISVIIMEESVGTMKVINNMNALQAENLIREKYDFSLSTASSPIARLIREGIEEVDATQQTNNAELDAKKKEMVEIEEMITRIENLGDDVKADAEMQKYYQELLVRRNKVREEINTASMNVNAASDPSMATPEGISNALYDAFEDLRERMGILKTTDADTTQINGSAIKLTNELTATPVIIIGDTEQDVIDQLLLKITGADGTDAGVADMINTKFKEFGVRVIDGDELTLNCTFGSLNSPFDDSLKAAITSVVTKLVSPDMDAPKPEDANSLDHPVDDKDDDNPDADKDNPDVDADNPDKTKGDKGIPPIGAKDDKDDKGNPIKSSDGKGDKFEGKLLKYKREDLLLLAKNTSDELADIIGSAMDGKPFADKEPTDLKKAVEFLNDKGETELADYIKTKIGNDEKPDGNDDDPNKESEFTKKEKEKEKTIATTRSKPDSPIPAKEAKDYSKVKIPNEDYSNVINSLSNSPSIGELQRVVSSYDIKTPIEAFAWHLNNNGWVIDGVDKDGNIIQEHADVVLMEKYRKIPDDKLANEFRQLSRISDSSKTKDRLFAISEVFEERRLAKINEAGDENWTALKTAMVAEWGPIEWDTISESELRKVIAKMNPPMDYDVASRTLRGHDMDIDEPVKAKPTVESWKASLSSRNKNISYVKEAKRIIATANGRTIGVFPIKEEKTEDEGYVGGFLTEVQGDIPANEPVRVHAEQFLSGMKNDNVSVEYNGAITDVPKSIISINILESINENRLSRFEKEIIKKIFEDKLSDKELIKDLQEGLLGEIIGGITGFALGNKIGEVVAKCLGVGQGILYDLLTSRLFGAAIGAAIGDNA